jgi:hypothetical protein
LYISIVIFSCICGCLPVLHIPLLFIPDTEIKLQ